MEFKEIKEQINSWLDSKLNNPYFGSVIAVWIVTNRVLIYALICFDSNFTLAQRLSFIHQQFESFNHLDFLWGFKGFYATICWSLIWGIVIMVIYDQINTLGKALFKIVHKSYNLLLHKINPSKWMELKDHIEIQKKNNDLEEEIKTKRVEINRIQKDYDESIKLYSISKKEQIEIENKNKELEEKVNKIQKEYDESKNYIQIVKKEIEEKDVTIISINEKIKLQEEQIIELTEDKNKFRITYARYGKYDTFIEVTKIVSDLINNNRKFNVDNKDIGFDPLRYKVKELYIEYEYNKNLETLLADEQELIEIKDNKLIKTPTQESKQRQIWQQNQNKLNNIFKNEWTLIYIKENINTSEKVLIDNKGNYFVNNKYSFNIMVKKINDKQIILNKYKLDGELHSIETLEIINDSLIKGKDSIGFTLEYKKS